MNYDYLFTYICKGENHVVLIAYRLAAHPNGEGTPLMLRDAQIGKLDYIRNHNHNYLTQLLTDSANSLLFLMRTGLYF